MTKDQSDFFGGDIFAAEENRIRSLNRQKAEPLAARMRPRTLDEYIGQEHILGVGCPLRKALERGTCSSMILWGPPGTGKTTLAEIFAHAVNAEVIRLSAVTSGIKEIRQALDEAKSNLLNGQRTVLFVDEVHRFNKSQQDAFLPFIEDGTIIFIGATTENPSFELNNAVLSRARVYVLKSLTEAEVKRVLMRALLSPAGLNGEYEFADGALVALAQLAGGDARRSLNLLELAAQLATTTKEDVALNDNKAADLGPLGTGATELNVATPNVAKARKAPSEPEGKVQGGLRKLITLKEVAAVSGDRVARYDKNGDRFYDLISAFHKSVRGSSPQAALYWYARIVAAGGDPLYVARRLAAIASEDVGTADPRAMQVVMSAWETFRCVGPAEGERAIAEAAVYCAVAPKSNALYTAWNSVLEFVKNNPDYDVPPYLRNAPNKLMAELGCHEGYRYAHDEPGAYAAGECFLPPEIRHEKWYTPNDRGYEQQIQKKMAWLEARDYASPNQRYPEDFKNGGPAPDPKEGTPNK